MPLTLIVPGWHAATRSAALAAHLEALQRGEAGLTAPAVGEPEADRSHTVPIEVSTESIGLRWRAARDAPPCWRTALWAALWPEAVGDPAESFERTGVPAANDWVERIGQPMSGEAWLRADPVSLLADRDTAILRPPESLALSEHECADLAASLNAFLAEDGMTLHAVTPTGWYLSGPDLEPLAGPSPDALAFQAFDPMALRAASASKPHTVGRRRLRTLQSELEMVLHAHPVNRERRARGELTVSSLHLWGSSRPWPPASARAGATSLAGDDAFTRAAAAARGLACIGVQAGVSPSSAGSDGTAVVVDLSLLAAWARGDDAALDKARTRIIERHLQPLVDAGGALPWQSDSTGQPSQGVQIIAEAGWCHRVLPPAGNAASRLITQWRQRAARFSPRRPRS